MVRAPSTSLSMGYVPDGLTPEQYKKIQAEKDAKIKASKTKKRGYVSVFRFLNLSAYMTPFLALAYYANLWITRLALVEKQYRQYSNC